MARPVTKGLRYYPKDVDFYDDFKIMTLLEEYGPLGVVVYEVLLCFIYRGDGYYLAAPLDALATQVVRKIGSRWIPRKNDFVLQVIRSCVDIGLFDIGLFSQGVLTSAGIQRRYAEATVRSKADKSLYWLLEDSPQTASESIPSAGVFAAETRVFAAETGVIAAETPQIKENQIKENQSKVNHIKSNHAPARMAADRVIDEDDEEILMEFELIKNPSDRETQELLELTEQYDRRAVIMAIRRAHEAGGRSVGYVRSILENDTAARGGYSGGYLAGTSAAGRATPGRTAPPGTARHDTAGHDTAPRSPTHGMSEFDAMMFDEWFGDALLQDEEDEE